MNSRRLDLWRMLLEPPKGLTYANICKITKLGKKPRVWVSGLLLHMPRTPRHHLLPSPKPKSMPLSNAFRRVSPLPKLCNKSNDTCNLCREKGHWANECLNKACFKMKCCSDTTKPNGCSSGRSRHPGH